MEAPDSEPDIKFVWNATPNSKVQQARSIIHPAFHYTPFSEQNITTVDYPPLLCSCEALLNKFCTIDFSRKTVKCCFCNATVNLPPNYAKNIEPDRLPYEFIYDSMEFVTKNKKSQVNNIQIPSSSSNCFLFVVDLCLSDKQMNAVKQQLIKVIKGLPTDGSMFVGLVTFNKHVNISELSSKINTEYKINGAKDYNINQLMNLLGVNIKTDPQQKSPDILRRFIIPLNDKKDSQKIIRRIKDIKKDPSIYVSERSHRALGQAINSAICLAQAAYVPPRIVLLAGGPCTVGPGTVISPNLKELMRSAKELMNGENIKYFQSAKKYYDNLGKRVISKKIIIDLFAFSLEEIGLAEMSELLSNSGGYMVMHEQFSQAIFRQSFKKIFVDVKASEEAFRSQAVTQGVVSVFASKSCSINGALGQCYSLNKSKPFVSDKVIGKGKTHSWYLGSIDRRKTITVMYETRDAETKDQTFFIQMKAVYRNQNGDMSTRITTVQKEWSSIVPKISEGFDQDAAIISLARLCVHKSLMEEQTNVRQWLDTNLCKWASYFANYVKNDVYSFALGDTMKNFPKYIYYLRRSNFINRFGSSLDQSFYRAFILGRQNVQNCLCMIQPVLLKYSLEENEPESVALDEEEMQQNVILLLDSYFNIIEWYGQDIQEWWQEKYHEMQGYQHIGQLFNSPKVDIQYIMNNRFPVPNYYLTHPGHSKQRYLKSRVNPKKSMGQQNENTLTDDSDLKAFNEHLIKVVTTQGLN